MDTKEIIAIIASILGVLGTTAALYAKTSSFLRSKREKSRITIIEAIDRFSDEKEFHCFLRKIDKELILKEITGLRLTENDAQALFLFQERGITNLDEIRRAWAHKKIKHNGNTPELTFSLNLGSKILIFLGYIHFICCIIVAIILSFLAFFGDESKLGILLGSVFMIASAVVPFYAFDSELTAKRIISKIKSFQKE